MIENPARFKTIIQFFDEANSADPNQESWDGKVYPKELLYSQRMTTWLKKVYPEASELLQVAARCQHICRWEIPRSAYPMNKQGYHQWRRELQGFHAKKATALMLQVGYSEKQAARVEQLLRKKDLRRDEECQHLEDVICLVFLDAYFADFAAKHADEKVIAILQKTWRKMTSHGQQEAMRIKFPTKAEALIQQALS